ncbi:MAG: DEAD/DEAH box helicase [Treponema sp.]|jgi:ATP-dependent RNA helicase RhlB|nr:DEAD/DEAH box helicase [Treponema sp.]
MIKMNFTELNLNAALQKGIAECGYTVCTSVQEQVLNQAFTGQDLYVQSQTGTGKTAAFLTVIFQRLLSETLLHGKKALIMAPTRELAVQIEDEAQRIGKYLPFKTGSFFGGVGYGEQQAILKNNVQIMVGTPGRVIDLNQSGAMNLIDIAFLVIDEADRMFDMGFYPDLRKLLKVVPPVDKRQTMLFSATLNTYIKNLAWEYTKDPIEIEIQPEIKTVAQVQQVLYHVPSEDKLKLLLGVLERENPESAIIFCNTKKYTEILARRLSANGYKCEYIIGDLPQPKRLKIIEGIKEGKIRYLTATDVAARGLDIEDLSMVVNYDLPVEAENYIHRIGRTARAGKRGKAVTFASEQDVYELADIEKYIEQKIPSEIANKDLYAEDKTAERRASQAQREQSIEKTKKNEKTSDAVLKTRTLQTRGKTVLSSKTQKSKPAPKAEHMSGARKAPPTPNVDLSAFSFEERMVYYKEKYGPNKKAQKSGRQRRQTGKNAERNKRLDSAQKILSNKQKPTASTGAGDENAHRFPQQRPPITDSHKTIAGSTHTVAAHVVLKDSSNGSATTTRGKAEKQGLIARIFGFFRKK